MKKNFGFTLIEILIALAIFSVVSVIATQALQDSVITKNKLMKKVNRVNDLKMAYQILERDLEGLINRPIIDQSGKRLPAVLVPISQMTVIGTQAAEKTKYGLERLEFTRSGHSQWLLDADSSLQRVGYYLNGDKLFRHAWRVLDRAPSTQADVRLILDKINKLDIKFYDSKGNLSSDWEMDACLPTVEQPCKDKKTELPSGIVVMISLDDMGDIAWIFVN